MAAETEAVCCVVFSSLFTTQSEFRKSSGESNANPNPNRSPWPKLWLWLGCLSDVFSCLILIIIPAIIMAVVAAVAAFTRRLSQISLGQASFIHSLFFSTCEPSCFVLLLRVAYRLLVLLLPLPLPLPLLWCCCHAIVHFNLAAG